MLGPDNAERSLRAPMTFEKVVEPPEFVLLVFGCLHYRQELLLRFVDLGQDQFAVARAFIIVACQG